MGQCQNQNLDLYDVKAKEYRIDREESKELTRLRANLGMKWSDISRIHGAYNILDLDDSGWISRAEFLRVVGCEPSDFGNEIFRIFDRLVVQAFMYFSLISPNNSSSHQEGVIYFPFLAPTILFLPSSKRQEQ